MGESIDGIYIKLKTNIIFRKYFFQEEIYFMLSILRFQQLQK
jgi:hypothetical protein